MRDLRVRPGDLLPVEQDRARRVSACSPAIDHSSVVLPQPDGPMTQTNSPSRTSIENRSSACTRPLRVS